MFLFLSTSFAQKQKPRPRDWFVFDVYGTSWENTPSTIDHIHWKSVGFGFNVVKDFPLGYSPHSFAIGLSYSVDKVHSNAYFISSIGRHGFDEPQYSAYYLIPSTGKPYLRNKLVTHYIDLPIELRLRTKVRSKFFTYIGVKGGYNTVSFQRSASNTGNKNKTYGIPALQDFRYGPTFRIGFGAIGLYGFYNMNGLLKGRPNTFIPFSIGISYLSGR